MGKDPAFLFYAQDFLTGTMFMSNEQVGIYIRLLCAQHQHGGFISIAAFDSLVGNDELIRSKFTKSKDGYFNKRLLDEMARRQKKSDNLSKNAKKRWIKEKQKQNKSNAIASDLHVPIETETETEIEASIELINTRYQFAEFWDLYDKKVGKKSKIEKKWNALSKDTQETILIHVEAYKKAQPDKQYRKNPETYLNNESWNDEIIEGGNGTHRKQIGASEQELTGLYTELHIREQGQ